jgi:hypothetical protein
MNPTNSRTPTYIKDIYQLVESVPFGDVSILIKRVDRKTTQLSTDSQETLRYVNNQEALNDLINMVTKLMEASFSGEAHVKLDMKDGNIRIIGIYDRKDQKYN